MQLRSESFPNFGLRLKRLRRAMGVKQSALADLLDVNQSTLSRWEAGLQIPDAKLQNAAFASLSEQKSDDRALRRLVESSTQCVHLVEEATHICLAYSKPRAHNWQCSTRELLDISLWPFASEEIQKAEAELSESDWWTAHMPEAKIFTTKEVEQDTMRISGGLVMWERFYLADGTPVRLVTGV